LARSARTHCDVDYKPRELLCKRPHQIAAHAMQSRAGVKYLTGFAARKEPDTEEVVAMPRLVVL
jgi:hypothetical protein